MVYRQFLIFLLAGAAIWSATPASADEESRRHLGRFVKPQFSLASVGAFPALPDGSLERVDATSVLFRTKTGVGFTLNTRSLAPNAPYTAWWVVFNRPRACLVPFECGSADLSNPDVKPGVFYASGRVADAQGQGSFAAEIGYGELPEGDGQIPNPARANPIKPWAEIHIVLRSHGPALEDPEDLEAQLSQFNGGCPPNACANAQASVHPSPRFHFR